MGLLLIEQAFNGLQFGVMLFLIATGLTLVFGIMDLVNLSHGSLVMVGAYLATTLIRRFFHSQNSACTSFNIFSRIGC